MTAPADFETAMTRLKKTVYKTRMRLKDFFVDFDRLNTGFVYPNHFLSALSMAGEFPLSSCYALHVLSIWCVCICIWGSGMWWLGRCEGWAIEGTLVHSVHVRLTLMPFVAILLQAWTSTSARLSVKPSLTTT